MLGHDWQMQWRRVLRRLEDVRAVYAGREGGTDDAVDLVLSFFEAVHHLKDWLRNDPSSGITRADVESLINASRDLQLCADLANGSKHFTLTYSRTGDLATTIARNDAEVRLGAANVAHRFYVQSAGLEYDVLQIAEGAVTEWRAYLMSRGLI